MWASLCFQCIFHPVYIGIFVYYELFPKIEEQISLSVCPGIILSSLRTEKASREKCVSVIYASKILTSVSMHFVQTAWKWIHGSIDIDFQLWY